MANYTIRNGASGMTSVTANAAITSQRSQITSPNHREWIKAGKVWSFGTGALTTPAAFQTDLVRQTPENMIRVPKGYVVIPLMAQATYEATGAAVAQILVSACNNDPGTANISAATAVNVNTRYAGASPASQCYLTPTGASGTAPTGVSDLLRAYQQVDNDAVTGSASDKLQFVYNPLAGIGQECVIGDNAGVNAFLFYVANGTSSTGFTIVTFAEFTYDEYYAAS